MGAILNATNLRKNDQFKEWVATAIVYQARIVILEADTVPDHAIRLTMAQIVVVTPAGINELMAALIATKPEVANTVTDPATIPDSTILTEVANNWTAVAKLQYGQ